MSVYRCTSCALMGLMTDVIITCLRGRPRVIMLVTSPRPRPDDDHHLPEVHITPGPAAQQPPSQPSGFLCELFESWKPLNMTETEIIFPLSEANNKKLLL